MQYCKHYSFTTEYAHSPGYALLSTVLQPPLADSNRNHVCSSHICRLSWAVDSDQRALSPTALLQTCELLPLAQSSAEPYRPNDFGPSWELPCLDIFKMSWLCSVTGNSRRQEAGVASCLRPRSDTDTSFSPSPSNR